MMVLDFGCGKAKTVRENDTVIGIDVNERSDADVFHDLNSFPYPFPDNKFDEIICNDILEHLDDFFGVMKEIHRIGKNGAIVRVKVPHFSSMDAYTDPTHKRSFTSMSFSYITGDFPPLAFYEEYRFKMIKYKIVFWKFKALGGIKPQEWFGLGIFANKFTRLYEHFFAFIFPAQYIYFELEVTK